MNVTSDQVVAYLRSKAAQRRALASATDADQAGQGAVIREQVTAMHQHAALVLDDIARDVEERATLGLAL